MSWPDEPISRLVKGARPTLLEEEKGNELIDALNVLRNFEITPGNQNQVLLSEDGIKIEFTSTLSDFNGQVEVLDATDITKKWIITFEDGVLRSIEQQASAFEEKVVQICEDGSAVDVTFVVKS
tara:strand:- start:413 stop:784 length:372 start_codon:yes stop_codon:yes gene_type:complete